MTIHRTGESRICHSGVKTDILKGSFVLGRPLKLASSSEWLITNGAIPAHILAVLDWKNGTISIPVIF